MSNKTQYRIVGRFVKDEKTHVVDSSPRWTKQDAEKRLQEIIAEQERAKKAGEYRQNAFVSVVYYPEYELVDLKIQQREVTPWADVQ